MGLDIFLGTDNYEEISELELFETLEENFNLSREFCNLMCRKNVIEKGIPELDQIAEITDCDLSFFYLMEEYVPEEDFDELFKFDEDENVELSKNHNLLIENNLDAVILSLKSLIEKLNEISNLENKIDKTDYDTIGIEYYFSNFKIDKGEGYIGNNFGQDLRNFLKFAQFAKENSAKTIYFTYG